MTFRGHWTHTAIWIFCAIVTTSTYGSEPMKLPENQYYTLPKNCDFTKLANGKTDNDCTPKLVDSFSKFRGIAINGPDTVVWPKGTPAENNVGPFGTTMGLVRLVIPTMFLLPRSISGLSDAIHNDILYVAVNQKTNSVYKGKHPRSGFKPQKRYELPGHPLPSNDSNKAIYGVVNPDLVDICGLPVENATYTVYATLASYKSNVLTIKTVVK